MTEERLPMPEKRRTSCPFCDQTFTDASNRRRHVRRKHGADASAADELAQHMFGDAVVTPEPEPEPERTTAGEIAEHDVMLWLGVAREIVKVRALTQGMVRMWISDAWWFDIPARTPVQRMDK